MVHLLENQGGGTPANAVTKSLDSFTERAWEVLNGNNPYEVLGVTHKASSSTIDEAFKSKISLELDLYKHIQLQAAYHVLHPEVRAQTDERLNSSDFASTTLPRPELRTDPTDTELRDLHNQLKFDKSAPIPANQRIDNFVAKLTEYKIDPNSVLSESDEEYRKNSITNTLASVLRSTITKYDVESTDITSIQKVKKFCNAVDSLLNAGFDNNTFRVLNNSYGNLISEQIGGLLHRLTRGKEDLDQNASSVVKLLQSAKAIGADVNTIIRPPDENYSYIENLQDLCQKLTGSAVTKFKTELQKLGIELPV
jgi:hypothetical protein